MCGGAAVCLYKLSFSGLSVGQWTVWSWTASGIGQTQHKLAVGSIARWCLEKRSTGRPLFCSVPSKEDWSLGFFTSMAYSSTNIIVNIPTSPKVWIAMLYLNLSGNINDRISCLKKGWVQLNTKLFLPFKQ